MKLYRGTNVSQSLLPVVITIGNFDGIHLGHQRILDFLLKQTKIQKAKSMVLSFYPITKNANTLMSFREKWRYLSNLGVDYLWMLPFFIIKQWSWQRFIQFLNQRLLIKQYVLGADFRFGYQRQGQVRDCEQKVTVVPLYKDEQRKISSSSLRSTDQLEQLNRYLGRHYAIIRRIVKGDGYGKVLGFPTINMASDFLPLQGVFLGYTLIKKTKYWGLINVGTCPTFQKQFHLELHLLDFNGQIKERFLSITFLSKIRNEICFNSADALVQQIQNDIQAARQIICHLKS